MCCKTTPGRERIRGQALGSTVGTLDACGNQVNTTVYAAFGGVSYAAGTLPTDKTFTGQRLDDTGLYYYGARYYDPEIGRFISPDIFVQDCNDPQTLNRHAYCRNNPLKYTDPTGWWTFGIKIGIHISIVGLNLTFNGGIVGDNHGGIAFIGEKSAGVGFTIASASIELSVPVTSDEYIGNLGGKDYSIGGSTDVPNIGVARLGLDVGVDYDIDASGGEVSVGLGVGIGPGEAHLNQNESSICIIRDSNQTNLPSTDIQIPYQNDNFSNNLPISDPSNIWYWYPYLQ